MTGVVAPAVVGAPSTSNIAAGEFATTSYAANGYVFRSNTGGLPRTFVDGTSNTVMFAERYQVCTPASTQSVPGPEPVLPSALPLPASSVLPASVFCPVAPAAPFSAPGSRVLRLSPWLQARCS